MSSETGVANSEKDGQSPTEISLGRDARCAR
jgi:hypothetical protein